MPVFIDGIWSAYMYDTHELKVHIIDMVYVPYRLMLHQHFHKIVCSSLVASASKFYQGWSLDGPAEWEINFPQLCPHDIPRFRISLHAFHVSVF